MFTVRDLKEVREKGYVDGHGKGYNKGYHEGYYEGHFRGHNQGFHEGQNKECEEAYTEGRLYEEKIWENDKENIIKAKRRLEGNVSMLKLTSVALLIISLLLVTALFGCLVL